MNKILEAIKLIEEIEADTMAEMPAPAPEEQDAEPVQSEGEQALALLQDIRDLMSRLVDDEIEGDDEIKGELDDEHEPTPEPTPSPAPAPKVPKA